MPRGQRSLLAGILLVSVLLRTGAVLYLGDRVVPMPGTADQISYHALALRVLGGHGFSFAEAWWPATAAGAPTAHWSYLYTFFLTGIYGLFGAHPLVARLLQVLVVGLLQPYLTYLLARRVFPTTPGAVARAGEWIALLAAALAAGYAYFIYYAATLMTEPFYITAILAVLYLALVLLDRLSEGPAAGGNWKLTAGFGLLLGATVLLRQLFMLFLPLLFLWLLGVAWRRRILGPMLQRLVLAGAIVVLTILPFTLYNQVRFERFVLLNTNAGYAFYLANHPIYGTEFVDILPPEMGSYGDLIPAELRHLDEAALDQALLARGIGFVVEDPGRYLQLSLSRIPSYFKFWPSPDSNLLSNLARVGSFAILLPFMLYGLVRALRRPSTAMWLLILFMVFYTGIHLLVWTLIRYRLPVDAVLILFAAYGLTDLATHFGSRAKTRSIDASPPRTRRELFNAEAQR